MYCFYSCLHFSFFLPFQLVSVTMSVVSRTFFSHSFRTGTLVPPPQPSFLEDALVSLSCLKDVFTRSERPVERPFLSAPGQVASFPLAQPLLGMQGPFSYLSLRWQPACYIQPSSLKGFFRGLLIVCQDSFLFGFSPVPTSHGLFHAFSRPDMCRLMFLKNWGNTHCFSFSFS